MLNLHQISRTQLSLLPTLLASISDNRIFKKIENRQNVIKNINSMLILRESRQCALSTLSLFCDYNTVEDGVITEKTSPEISWIEQCLKIIEQESQYHGICFDILGKLLRITAANPDTNKIVQSKYVQKIVDAVIGGSSAPINALNCLAICMEIHAGTSGIYKNKIYDYCIAFVDNPESELMEIVAICLHLLQQTRGGSVGGGVYKKCWAEFHEKTIASMNEVLNRMKKKTEKDNVGKSEKLQLPELKLSPEPVNLFTQLLVRFKNLSTILKIALQQPFPVAKSIQVHRLLSLVEDGISINQVVVGKKVLSENAILNLMNSEIQQSLLTILRTLMKCLNGNVLTLSKAITDILWKCLKQTAKNEQAKCEVNLKLRSDVYETLIVFMKLSPNNVFVKSIMENVMKETLIDVTPAIDESFLIISTATESGGGGKKKKKGNVNGKLLKGKSSFSLVNVVDEQRTCAKALECLECLLIFQGVLMKPALFYVMQEKILAIGFRISSSVPKEDELYHDVECRKKLNDLVLQMMLHPVHKLPAPINYGLALLSKVRHSDVHMKVRENAADNLQRAESALHNRKEVFYFPSDYRELRDTLLFNKQTIQKLADSSQNGNLSEKHSHKNNTKNVELFSETEDESEDSDLNDDDDKMDGNQNESKESFESALEDEQNVVGAEEEEEEEMLNQNDNEDEDEDEGEEIIKPPVQEIKTLPTPSPPQNLKRTQHEVSASVAVNDMEKASKKPRKSDPKDEEVVDEMLADFDDD